MTPSSVQSKQRLIIILLLMAAAWLACLAWLLSIPADPKNAVLFGLSAARLVLAAVPVLLALTAGFLAWKVFRSAQIAEKLSSFLCRLPVFTAAFGLFVLTGLFLAASVVLGDAARLASYAQRLQPLLLGGAVSLGVTLLYAVVFGEGLVSYTHKSEAPARTQIAPCQPALALVVPALLVYLAAGMYTEWGFLQANPLPERLHYDFGYYMQGLQAVLADGSPYADLSLGTGFLYPLPSLLVVELFAQLPLVGLRQGLYLLFNLALLGGMVWGVARHFHLSLRQMWWWFPLTLGFAPTLEMLHAGQINMITEFGLFLLFIWEAARPVWGGVGLAMAIVTKLSPVLFLPYLLANRRWKTALAALGGVAVLGALAGLRYGWQPLVEYGQVFQSLMERLPLGENPQSLASKLFVAGWLDSAQAQTFHSLLTLFLGLVLSLSALAAYLTREREPFFIITALAMMLSANIMWYHHYVFFLLPLLVWMAWRRLDPRVVAWVFGGMLLIQFDRWGLTTGLLAHIFGHLTILWLLAGQIREMMPVVNTKRSAISD